MDANKRVGSILPVPLRKLFRNVMAASIRSCSYVPFSKRDCNMIAHQPERSAVAICYLHPLCVTLKYEVYFQGTLNSKLWRFVDHGC